MAEAIKVKIFSANEFVTKCEKNDLKIDDLPCIVYA